VGEISRRDFLKASGAGAVLLGGGSALAACGSSPSSSTSSTIKTSAPHRGGTLRVGMTGGASSDTLDSQAIVENLDVARTCQLNENLCTYNADAQVELVLAEEVTPNADGTEWTIRLRPGVTFHNGKDLTAEDVIFSFRRIANPKHPLDGGAGLAPVDLTSLKQLDPLTVRVSCTSPFASFYDTLATICDYSIVPVGYDQLKPVGTGPFKYKTFSPGVESLFTRNENYWIEGLPYLDAVMISDFADETAQINALAANQLDAAPLLSPPSIPQVKSGGGHVVISDGGGITPFTMRVDVPPFSDVRVRQAMRLVVDRPQMLKLLFEGYGTIGNDIACIWDPAYDRSIPQREQNLDKARSLLKQAGHEGLSVELVTSNIAQGTVAAATVLAQQASAAGMTINLRNVTGSEIFGPNYLKWLFAQDFYSYQVYLVQAALCALPSSPFNECHQDFPRYNSIYSEALRTVDVERRNELVHELQLIDYDMGGYIIPYFPPVIDGYRSSLQGVIPSKTGVSFNNFDFRRFSLA
jgi:peptide/nickel transport system substrate-binding protein